MRCRQQRFSWSRRVSSWAYDGYFWVLVAITWRYDASGSCSGRTVQWPAAVHIRQELSIYNYNSFIRTLEPRWHYNCTTNSGLDPKFLEESNYFFSFFSRRDDHNGTKKINTKIELSTRVRIVCEGGSWSLSLSLTRRKGQIRNFRAWRVRFF